MAYQIAKGQICGQSVFWIGCETGALYVRSCDGFICVDANGSAQRVGTTYSAHAGTYRQIEVGSILKIEVGK